MVGRADDVASGVSPVEGTVGASAMISVGISACCAYCGSFGCAISGCSGPVGAPGCAS